MKTTIISLLALTAIALSGCDRATIIRTHTFTRDAGWYNTPGFATYDRGFYGPAYYVRDPGFYRYSYDFRGDRGFFRGGRDFRGFGGFRREGRR